MTCDGDWRDSFRPDIPSVARIYDYLLGGKDNYPVDREVGESMIAQLPNVRLAVQWNRAFLRRVVRYLIREAGIKQIIDVGAGLPTVGNTHEVALEACPQAGMAAGSRRPGTGQRRRVLLLRGRRPHQLTMGPNGPGISGP